MTVYVVLCVMLLYVVVVWVIFGDCFGVWCECVCGVDMCDGVGWLCLYSVYGAWCSWHVLEYV